MGMKRGKTSISVGVEIQWDLRNREYELRQLTERDAQIILYSDIEPKHGQYLIINRPIIGPMAGHGGTLKLVVVDARSTGFGGGYGPLGVMVCDD